MLCSKFGKNWPSGTWEEVKIGKVYRQTDGQKDRQTTCDQKSSFELSDKCLEFFLLINVMIAVSIGVYWMEMFFGWAMWPMHDIVLSACFLAIMTIHHDLTFFFCAGDHLILSFSHHQSKYKTTVTLIVWSFSSFLFQFNDFNCCLLQYHSNFTTAHNEYPRIPFTPYGSGCWTCFPVWNDCKDEIQFPMQNKKACKRFLKKIKLLDALWIKVCTIKQTVYFILYIYDLYKCISK